MWRSLEEKIPVEGENLRLVRSLAEEYFRTEFPQYAGELGTLFSVYSEEEIRTLFELMMRMYAGLDKLEALTLKGEEEK